MAQITDKLLKQIANHGSCSPNERVDMAKQLIAARAIITEYKPSSVPMILHCPECGTRHIDEGEFATKPHHTHACQHCGLPWRPAVINTVGVRFLPGFKNPAPPPPGALFKQTLMRSGK